MRNPRDPLFCRWSISSITPRVILASLRHAHDDLPTGFIVDIL